MDVCDSPLSPIAKTGDLYVWRDHYLVPDLGWRDSTLVA
jgi:hypothetical protein